jgi:sugar O-acyltransferase (sialic acid O-acetyltransferase NeuD family)
LPPPRKLLIVGDSAFAEIAFEYFTHDSDHRVIGFAVEREFLRRDSLFDLPVIALEDAPNRFPPGEHSFYAALVYSQRNRLRARLYRQLKSLGYSAASYVSSRAFVWRNVRLGEHCFVFENNVVQPFVTLGDDCVLWSGNHIGHHSRLGDDCFVSSHVVISGFCEIGSRCFMGVNSTVANNVAIGDDCLVGAGSTVLGDVAAGQTVVGLWKRPTPPAALPAADIPASPSR